MSVLPNTSYSFFERSAEVFSNSDNLIEGSFWGIWCLFSTDQWRLAYLEKRDAAGALLTPAEKTQRVWEANKNFALASCSFASGISMVLSWMNQVDLLPLGQLAGYVGATGFGGSGIVSGSKCVEKLHLLNQQRVAYFGAEDPKEKSNLALDVVSTMIKVAFFAAMTSWGVLGAAFSLYGGATLFVAQDTAFYYCAITFLGLMGSEVLIPLAKKLP